MKSVIVGNAGSCFDRELGSKIDEFDLVIRTNCFEILGYEKKVGSKIDIISFGGNSPAWEIVAQKYLKQHNPWNIKEIWLKEGNDHPLNRIDKFKRYADKAEKNIKVIQNENLQWLIEGFPEIQDIFTSYKLKNPSTSIRTCIQALKNYGIGNVYLYNLFGGNYYSSQKIVIDSEREPFWDSIRKDHNKLRWYEKYDKDGIDYFETRTKPWPKGEVVKKYLSPLSLFEKNHNFKSEKSAIKDLIKLNYFHEL